MTYRTLILAVIFLFGVSICIAQSSDVEKKAKTEDEFAWKQMFDGKTLNGWTTPKYGGDGDVEVKDGCIVIGQGAMITGIKYDKLFPRLDYEVRFEAKRMQGNDFFAAMTFPVGENCCTLVNGGWGGGTTGLSSIDGLDASENETTSYFSYTDYKWHKFRIRVTGKEIKAWVEEETKDGKRKETEIVDIEIEGRKVSLRDETSQFQPVGFCTWVSEGWIRDIEYRKLKPEEVDKPDEQQ